MGNDFNYSNVFEMILLKNTIIKVYQKRFDYKNFTVNDFYL